jgi:imidazolonepropionase
MRTPPLWDTLYCHANLATMMSSDDESFILNAAIAIKDGRIAWLGAMDDLPKTPQPLATTIIDAQQQWITPVLIDCHTHLVYGGHRAEEFAMKMQGCSYSDIAKAGGGIVSTVRATRAASEEELLAAALPRVKALMNEGVRIIEIKSGYGLDAATEKKLLRVAKQLQSHYPIQVQATFLGAHAVPAEFANDAEGYIDHLCQHMLPILAAEGLIDAVDGFCETIAFSRDQIKRVFDTATSLGLPVKLHAEQLSDQQGAELVAHYQGLSADHLEFVSEISIAAMAQAKTVAVLLPGAYYYLRETQLPPIAMLRHYQVPIALATDCNPGTSPICSLRLIMNMGCVLFKLTPAEVLLSVTKHAAQALGLQQDYGTLEVGKKAAMIVWKIKHPVELMYELGVIPEHTVLWDTQS